MSIHAVRPARPGSSRMRDDHYEYGSSLIKPVRPLSTMRFVPEQGRTSRGHVRAQPSGPRGYWDEPRVPRPNGLQNLCQIQPRVSRPIHTLTRKPATYGALPMGEPHPQPKGTA